MPSTCHTNDPNTYPSIQTKEYTKIQQQISDNMAHKIMNNIDNTHQTKNIYK